MSAVCVSVVCLVLGREGGLELEVGILAFADAPEVGFLVGGDAVVADVEGRQCPLVVVWCYNRNIQKQQQLNLQESDRAQNGVNRTAAYSHSL